MSIDNIKKTIDYTIPLTAPSGKIRVKRRSILNEYGVPVATKSNPFSLSSYIEWQIGYDLVTAEINESTATTLIDKQFIGANGKTKSLYELSEIAYYFVKWGLISQNDVKNVYDFLLSINSEILIDVHPNLRIKRTDFIVNNILGIEFQKSEVSYPLLIHKFGKFEIVAEILIKEKQRAIGVQPMLYLCFPITELKTELPLLNRCANTKEIAHFVFSNNNSHVILQMLKIFGILSNSHKHDILEILKILLSV